MTVTSISLCGRRASVDRCSQCWFTIDAEGQKKPQDGQKGEYDKTGGEEYNSPDHADGGRPHPQPGHHLDCEYRHMCCKDASPLPWRKLKFSVDSG